MDDPATWWVRPWAPVTCILRRVRLAAPGYVARASGVLWTGRGVGGVQSGRCGVSGTRGPTIRVGWPDNRYAGPAASVRFRAGTVRSPTDFGPAAPACVLRGGRPITGKTLPTGPNVSGSRRNVGWGQVPAGVPLTDAAAREV